MSLAVVSVVGWFQGWSRPQSEDTESGVCFGDTSRDIRRMGLKTKAWNVVLAEWKVDLEGRRIQHQTLARVPDDLGWKSFKSSYFLVAISFCLLLVQTSFSPQSRKNLVSCREIMLLNPNTKINDRTRLPSLHLVSRYGNSSTQTLHNPPKSTVPNPVTASHPSPASKTLPPPSKHPVFHPLSTSLKNPPPPNPLLYSTPFKNPTVPFPRLNRPSFTLATMPATTGAATDVPLARRRPPLECDR